MKYRPVYADPAVENPPHWPARPGEFRHCSHWHGNVGPCCYCKRQRLREDDDRDCTTDGWDDGVAVKLT